MMELRANIHKVATEQKEDYTLTPQEKREILSQLNKRLFFGDFIENVMVSGYRNDGLFMWNGKDIVDLDNNIDDYGHLPKQFEIWVKHPQLDFEIPAKYWDYIKHNDIVNFDISPYLQRIKDLEVHYDNILFNGKYAIYVTWDNEHYIVYDVNSFQEENLDVNNLNSASLKIFSEQLLELLSRKDIVYSYTSFDENYPEVNFEVIFLSTMWNKIDYPLN